MSTVSSTAFTANREQSLLAYIADLELEVDRLRRNSQFIQQSARDAVRKIQPLCTVAEGGIGSDEQETMAAVLHDLDTMLHDLRELPGYHPAHDQVIVVAVRPLVDQVLRWHQRVLNVPNVALRLDLEQEFVEWFPARFRHILDNLIANALQWSDSSHGEIRITVTLRKLARAYELRISGNSQGLGMHDPSDAVELFHRSSPARSEQLGVGLSVVKMLIEQSGGALRIESGEQDGTSCVAELPRFDIEDYL